MIFTMLDMNDVVGSADVLMVTLDCLRYDVAGSCDLGIAWEKRETPGTFTLPAHLAFFHGFLPTPMTPGPHPRLFALEFDGSLSTAPTTCVFRDVPDIITGFAARGYRTCCIGGVGFFNKLNPLGHVLPGYFQDSLWAPALGVAAPDSTAAQVRAALQWLRGVPAEVRVMMLINISATHPPHAHYIGAAKECVESQRAALLYAHAQLPPLLDTFRRRGECFCLFMGDHGEAYGEDGRFGHRLAHPVVTTVPYAHFFLR